MGVKRHRVVVGSTVFMALAMLGLSFASVPLYRMFCAATGYGGTTQVATGEAATEGTRKLTVRFDANVGPGLTWSFSPETPQIELKTGKTATVFFKVTNKSDRETRAQALYNVTPEVSGAYFDKISCFCFTEQHLGPGETMDMPVVFYLDPALEQDRTMAKIDAITLSYTFYPARGPAPVAAAETKPKL